jgi:hypothetical protein
VTSFAELQFSAAQFSPTGLEFLFNSLSGFSPFFSLTDGRFWPFRIPDFYVQTAVMAIY